MKFGGSLKDLKFGSFKSENHFNSYVLKIMILLIPSILIGHYIDEYVKNQELSSRKSVFLQLTINVIVIYIFHVFLKEYTDEFQKTLAGLFFTSLYFGMQTNLISNLKTVFRS